MSGIELIVDIFSQHQLGLVIQSRTGIDQVFGSRHAACTKLFECLSEDLYITLKLRRDDGVEMFGKCA